MNKLKYCLHLLIFLILSLPCLAEVVRYAGVSELQQKQIASRFSVRTDTEVSISKIDRIVKFLMATELFESVSAFRETSGDVLIRGVPIREFYRVDIEGNSQLSSSEIREVIDIDPGSKFDQRTAVEAGEKIKAFYGESGFFNAIIEIDVTKVDERRMVAKYKIVEGNPCRITNIKFESDNSNLNSRLENRFGPYLRRRLSSKNIQSIVESASRYLVSRDFFQTKLEGPKATYNEDKSESVITFSITSPYSYEFVFEGIEDGQNFYQRPSTFRHQEVPKAKRYLPSRADIMRAIHLEEDSYLLNPESTMTTRLKDFFLGQGYPKVEVNSSTETDEIQFLKTLKFEINPGARVVVKKWTILGRISRGEDYYSDLIKDNGSSLLKRGYFHREGFDLGQKNLVTELKNQGFLKAKIQSSRVEYTGEHGEFAEISVNLDEGPLTQIRKISFIGNKDFSDLKLAEVFKMKSNTPLRLTQLESSLEKLKRFYYSRGYLEMKVQGKSKNTVIYSNKGTEANINVKIYEGPKIRAKLIMVEGNSFTDQDVVLRSLSFKQGDLLTPTKLEDSISRINRLGIFSRVTIQFLEEGTSIANRTVLITVDERDPGVFRVGAGVNSIREITARTFTGISYNNLFGTGRGVSLRGELRSNIADINYLEHQINAGYIEPFLFGTQVRGRLNVSRSDEVFNVIEGERDLVNILEREQFSFLLEKQISKRTTLTWTLLSLESRTSRERDGFCLEEDNANATNPEKCGKDFQQVSRIGPVVDLDYRDNALAPKRGSYSRLGIDYASPWLGSSEGIEFARLDGLFRYYLPLPSKMVWANEFRSGYLSNLSPDGESGVPASYAFFLGGYATVRGYDFTEAENRIPRGTPRPGQTRESNTFLDVRNAAQLLIKSDSHYYMMKSELRFPVSETLGGVVFYDGGAVLVSGFDFIDPYRDAVGFGARINTPVGPIALDVGFKLDRLKDEEFFDFHFSISSF